MTKVTKRNVLKKIGASPALVTASISIPGDTEAQPDDYDEQATEPNFGVFNNSDEPDEITVQIGNQENILYSKQFKLRGLNEADVDEPSISYITGYIDIQASEPEHVPVVAVTDDGRRAESTVLAEGDGLSDYAIVSVYVRHDGELTIKNSMR